MFVIATFTLLNSAAILDVPLITAVKSKLVIKENKYIGVMRMD